MRNNSAKRKLAAGKPVSVVAPTYSSAGLVELLGRQGYDVIFIDCEHGPPSWDAVEDMVRAAELCDATPIIRVQSHDPSTITRALDRGAGGVQIPHVNTRGEAEAVVRHAKFAPIGHRGFAGGRSAFGETPHDFTRRANEETMVVVMLEEQEALRNLDDILETKHVDVFFVAPGDLAQSMGHPGQMDHPAVQAAIDDVSRASVFRRFALRRINIDDNRRMPAHLLVQSKTHQAEPAGADDHRRLAGQGQHFFQGA